MNDVSHQSSVRTRRSVLVVEDNEAMRRNFKRKFSRCEARFVEDPSSFKEIILEAIFERFDDILIDVNLSEFKRCHTDGSLFNGADIANVLRAFLPPSVRVSIISTDPNMDRFKRSISMLPPSVQVFSKDRPEDYERYFNRKVETRSQQTVLPFVYLNRSADDIFKLLGHFAWLSERNGVVQQDGFGPLLDNENYEEAVGEYRLVPGGEADYKALGGDKHTSLFWNFSTAGRLTLFFTSSFLYNTAFGTDDSKLSRMFNYQASYSLAKFYGEGEIPGPEIKGYLAQLSPVGKFCFQKFFLLQLKRRLQRAAISIDEFKASLDRFREVVLECDQKIIDIFIGTIQEVEPHTHTVWTTFSSVVTDDSRAEPMAEELFEKQGIQLFPGNCFYYIISENEIHGLARKIEPDYKNVPLWE